MEHSSQSNSEIPEGPQLGSHPTNEINQELGNFNELTQWFIHGMSTNADVLKTKLSLEEPTEDLQIALSLIHQLNSDLLGSLNTSTKNKEAPHHISEAPIATAQDTSIIGQLAFSENQNGKSIQNMDDLPVIQSMIKGGNLWQRKAATVRLGELLANHSKSFSNEQIKKAQLTLAQASDAETAYERVRAKMGLSGSLGKLTRIENEQWLDLAKKIKIAIRKFWDGEQTQEPIMSLPGDQRALLLPRTRDLEDWILEHINATIEGSDGTSDLQSRLGLISSLRNTSDERLIPSLRTVLEGEQAELHLQSARTLGQIQSPFVLPILKRAFVRSTHDETRIVLAGLLGLHGDFEHKTYVLTLLKNSETDSLTSSALVALRYLGSGVDAEKVTVFLTHKNEKIVSQAIQTLRHLGDLHTLEPLLTLRKNTEQPRLRFEISDAIEAIRARMDLRGEEISELHIQDTLLNFKHRKSTHKKNKFQLRMLGFVNFFWAMLLIAIGMHTRGIHKLQNITTKYSKWTTPWISLAMVWFKKGKFSQALPSFRRALELDRTRIEQNPILVRALAQCFIRRAEQIEKEGKLDVARGLIEEARAINLTQASSALRFELDRYQESLEKRLPA